MIYYRGTTSISHSLAAYALTGYKHILNAVTGISVAPYLNIKYFSGRSSRDVFACLFPAGSHRTAGSLRWKIQKRLLLPNHHFYGFFYCYFVLYTIFFCLSTGIFVFFEKFLLHNQLYRAF